MLNGLPARKLGMSQMFSKDGRFLPVTLLETGPCVVVCLRTKAKNGYDAVQLGFLTQKTHGLTNPEQGHLVKTGKMPKEAEEAPRVLKEFRVEAAESFQIGQEIKISDVFQVGDKVSVSGLSKGKGFQGVVKRYGMHGGPRTHGSRFHRRPGSIGTNTTPARVKKGQKLPGQTGNAMVTVRNLEIVAIDAEQNIVVVKGAVPGAIKGILVVRK